MEDNDKPFACSADGCNMRFTNEDHLTVHKKKHDMVLNLGNGQKNVFVADQTPTPTRFIRNCEEVGLFQDLQNVNPFEETFRKAVEAVKTGAAPLHEMDSLGVPVGADDTLHTPHVFPHIEDSTSNGADSYKSQTTPLISSTSVIMQNGQSKSSEDLSPIEERRELDRLLHPTSTTEDEDDADDSERDIILHHNVPHSKVVKQEADTSQHLKRSTITSQETVTKDLIPLDGLHTEPAAATGATAVQLLLRLPDGKIVQVSNFPVEQINTSRNSNAVLQATQPVTAQPTVVLATRQVPAATISVSKPVAPAVTASSTTNTNATSPLSQTASGISLAKLKLKQALTNVNRAGAATKDSSATIATAAAAAKQSIAKAIAVEAVKSKHESQPPGQASSSDKPQRRTSAASSGSGSEDAADKRQRFLERNRAAAMRCREKRKTWIQDLERRAEEMQNINQHLQAEVAALRAEVAQLKTLLLAHKDCPITQAMAQSGTQPQVINVTLPIPGTNGFLPSATPQPSQNQVILINSPAISTSSIKRAGDSVGKTTVKKKCLSVAATPQTAAPIHALLVPTTDPTFIEKQQISVKKTSSTLGVLVTNPVVTTPVPLVIPSQQQASHSLVTSTIFLPRNCLSQPAGSNTSQFFFQRGEEKGAEESGTVSNVIRVNPNVVRAQDASPSSVPGAEYSDDSDVEIITEIPSNSSVSR